MSKQNYGIQTVKINKSYQKKQVLFDVSLSVPDGKICGLLGPSGCGKTTLVKIISGILKADSGNVYISEKSMPSLDIMKTIGYMAQSAALYPTLTGYENLKFFGSLYGLKKRQLQARIEHVAQLVNLSDDLKRRAGEYSGGMQQRLSLATALLSDPSILLLDEPTVGIDPLLRQDIWEELYRLSDQGITILVTTHVMDEAEKCDSLAMMRDGRIIASGTPQQLQNDSGTNTLEDAFIYFGRPEAQKQGGVYHEN